MIPLHLAVRAIFLTGLAVGLMGCGTPPAPRIEIKEVRVPVPVSCVPAGFPEAPAYPDTDEALRAAPDAATRYALIAQGRLLRMARGGETEIVLKGCRSTDPPR